MTRYLYHYNLLLTIIALTTMALGGLFIHDLAAQNATRSPRPSNELNLSEATKTHTVYDLTIHLPASWKVESSFSNNKNKKHGSLRALDPARHLSYPRNLEIRVIASNIWADDASRATLQEEIARNYTSSNRQIKNYRFNGSEYIKVSGNEDAILLFSSLRLADNDYGHIHVAIPRHHYYYLLTYTDLKGLLSQNSDESFVKFWNIVSQISLPPRSIFSDRSTNLTLIFLAFLCALLSLWTLFYIRKKAQRSHFSVDDEDIIGSDTSSLDLRPAHRKQPKSTTSPYQKPTPASSPAHTPSPKTAAHHPPKEDMPGGLLMGDAAAIWSADHSSHMPSFGDQPHDKQQSTEYDEEDDCEHTILSDIEYNPGHNDDDQSA